MYDVFLSYSSKDRPIAEAVCAGLENEGLRCWIAPRDIPPGSTWAESIIEGISSCQIFLVILSSNANLSKSVQREVERALDRSKITIPFRIENIKPTGSMEFCLSATQWFDALTPPLEAHISKLVATIKSVLPSIRNSETDELINKPSTEELIISNEIAQDDQGSRISEIQKAFVTKRLAANMGSEVKSFGTDYRDQENQFQTVIKEKSSVIIRKNTKKYVLVVFTTIIISAAMLYFLLKDPTPNPENVNALIADNSYTMEINQHDPSTTDNFIPGQTREPIELGNGVSLIFVWIPSGSFSIGSPKDEIGREEDEDDRIGFGGDQLNVKIKGFWMGQSEVTQAQWKAVMDGQNPSYFKGDRLPVEQVSWNDIIGKQDDGLPIPREGSFISRLNEKTGLEFSLPTEAQWEYACRAGTSTKFYVGESDTELQSAAWFELNSDNATKPVRGRSKNKWGLFDMHGNVWEWCADWYWESYHENSIINLNEQTQGSFRSMRGGSWNRDSNFSRSANRGSNDPTAKSNNIGFRLVLME